MTPPHEPTDMETTLDCLNSCLNFMRNLDSSSNASYLGIISMRESVNVVFNLQDWRNKMETVETTISNLKISEDFLDLPNSQKKVEIDWKKVLFLATHEFQSAIDSILLESEKVRSGTSR